METDEIDAIIDGKGGRSSGSRRMRGRPGSRSNRGSHRRAKLSGHGGEIHATGGWSRHRRAQIAGRAVGIGRGQVIGTAGGRGVVGGEKGGNGVVSTWRSSGWRQLTATDRCMDFASVFFLELWRRRKKKEMMMMSKVCMRVHASPVLARWI